MADGGSPSRVSPMPSPRFYQPIQQYRTSDSGQYSPPPVPSSLSPRLSPAGYPAPRSPRGTSPRRSTSPRATSPRSFQRNSSFGNLPLGTGLSVSPGGGTVRPQSPVNMNGSPNGNSRTTPSSQSPTAGPPKEIRRAVLSHDEEVPEWDFASSLDFVTFGLFSTRKPDVSSRSQPRTPQNLDAFWVVSGGMDGSMRSWVVGMDGHVGEETFVPLRTAVMSVCLLHPGVVAAGTPNGAIKVIQPQGEVAFSSLTGHSGPVTGLAKLGPGRIATCSEDRTIRIFGTRVPVCEAVIEPASANGAPRCVAGMTSGQIVAGCDDGAVRVYNAGVSDSVWTFKGHTGPVLSVAGLDEVRCASGGSDGTIRLWRIAQILVERSLYGHGCPVTALAAVNLSRLVSGGENGHMRLWRSSDGVCLRVMMGHTGGITGLTVAPDGSRICSASKDRTVRVWRESGPIGEAPIVLEGHAAEVTGVDIGMVWESIPVPDRREPKRGGCSRIC